MAVSTLCGLIDKAKWC